MNELECQKLMVDAVKDGGGQALKLNNRFMIGVCDLMLKLPGHEPMLLEAKLINLSARTTDHQWDIGCTKLQRDFLRDWHDAGMLTGVVSFIQTTGVGIKSLRMTVYSFTRMRAEWGRPAWTGVQTDHQPLGDKDERFTNIHQQLINFAVGGI